MEWKRKDWRKEGRRIEREREREREIVKIGRRGIRDKGGERGKRERESKCSGKG